MSKDPGELLISKVTFVRDLVQEATLVVESGPGQDPSSVALSSLRDDDWVVTGAPGDPVPVGSPVAATRGELELREERLGNLSDAGREDAISRAVDEAILDEDGFFDALASVGLAFEGDAHERAELLFAARRHLAGLVRGSGFYKAPSPGPA